MNHVQHMIMADAVATVMATYTMAPDSTHGSLVVPVVADGLVVLTTPELAFIVEHFQKDYIVIFGNPIMKPKLRVARFVFAAALTLYTNLVLTNFVSYRQYWYTQTYNNGTALTPLYDSFFMDWIHGYNIPIPSSVTLRDMVDICTYAWVLLSLFVWASCSRKPIIIAKGLMAQMVLIPAFSCAQLLTVVPDSTPNCLEEFNIPTTQDVGWVFWRWPHRACGNMLWSSDITQLVVFTSLAVQMVPSKKHRMASIVWIVGECWTCMTIIFAFSSRYQYTVDVVTTYLVVKLAMSNPTITFLARWFFVKNGEYFERVPMQELPRATI